MATSSSPVPGTSTVSPAVHLEPDKRIVSRGKEPSRLKTHWDYVLEEMAWLAKDFESERKMKLSQAKKVAVRVSKSGLSTETRELRRLKGEEQRIRRVASNIAKDVRKFWTKIEKLIRYKHQLELEGRKKKALDKHLDFLVGQTERYSTMLAEIWADTPLDLALPSEKDRKVNLDGDTKQEHEHQDQRPSPTNLTFRSEVDKTSLDQRGHVRSVDANGECQIPMNVQKERLKPLDSSKKVSRQEPTLRKNSKTRSRAGKDDEDTEFSPGNGEVEDDFSTLEADEALITVEERNEELLALERESSLPLEELLKLYSSKEDEDDDENDDDDDDEEEEEEEGREEEEEEEEEDGEKEKEEEVEEEQEEVDGKADKEDEDDEEEEEKEEDEKSINLQEKQGVVSETPALEGTAATFEVTEERLHQVTKSEIAAEHETTGSSPSFKEESLEVTGVDRHFQKEPPESTSVEAGLNNLEEGSHSGYNLVDAAAAAQAAQPTGFTFSTTKVRTKLPFLLKHSLREYQHIGLDWLVTMYERRLNGILADEMGLGKTIMTISLLAHLACDKGIWGPHLIVVPTSVMLNWETEFMKWCPAFKILTYFGTAKERKVKRQGWSKANSFHVCITTYRLVIQDAKAFKRKKWKYLILDEAHLIKNWKSQRWQTLLNFNSKRRILLTGTPLQNDLMELWSLMHFLMPHVFQSHQEFRDWFNNPITGMVEGQEQINRGLVDRLHNVLRPFILRRLKQDVEKQLPKKYEHVVLCRLSKRQRNLYEDFMASSDTQATLSSGNFLGLLNVLMQLRKVCNHPDLFEGRPIVSSFDLPGIDLHLSSMVSLASVGLSEVPYLLKFSLLLSQLEYEMSAWEAEEVKKLAAPAHLIQEMATSGDDGWITQDGNLSTQFLRQGNILDDVQKALNEERKSKKQQWFAVLGFLNAFWCSRTPLYGQDFRKRVTIEHPVYDIHKVKADPVRHMDVTSYLADLVHLPVSRCEIMMDLLQAFVFVIPAARCSPPVAWCSRPLSSNAFFKPEFYEACKNEVGSSLTLVRPIHVRRQLFFPDRRLLQFDCGKLQELAVLLRRLRSEGHRALIFTQMTKMLDVLESFVNLHGYTYLRLDGSTKPEERQILMQRFNTNPKIFLFILSTRSGGVGVNLVGADTVIFYDSDWNPAMDQQAQDRCHRIGQTREVHIYRLISESTIEENILKKANQKRFLDDLVIQKGSYNTDFFKKLDPAELLSGLKGVKGGPPSVLESASETADQGSMTELSNMEVEAALKDAEDEADYMALKKVEQEEAAENQEFTEEGYSGKLDDDECADDLEEGKVSDKGIHSQDSLGGARKIETDDNVGAFGPKDIATMQTDLDADMDMMADVKQMAAVAAASGHGVVSFDSQLRPIERYAMQFLELWDPIIDKEAVETQVAFEETEWELDRLERLKQEQEAEIDEDNEPLVYESWDTSCADEAYRQQVEVLAQQEYQHRLDLEKLEEEMQEAERAEAEAALAAGIGTFEYKSKLKRAKFKSLGKGPFGTIDEAAVDAEDNLMGDADWENSDVFFFSPLDREPSQRKRKTPKLLEDDMLLELQRKRVRIGPTDQTIDFEREYNDLSMNNHASVVMLLDSSSTASENKKQSLLGGVPFFEVSQKKGPFMKLDKEKKKDGSKAGGRIPPADPWMPSEDAILTAVVHEYGGNWLLASETLAGVPDGGTFRGRYRYPVHCKERFRQLLANYTSIMTPREATGEKSGFYTAGSAPVKVTEEHIKKLLEVMQELPDDEWLLQRHFVALLTSVVLHTGQSSKSIKNTSLKLNSPQGRSFIRLPKISMNSTANSFLDKKVSDLNTSSPSIDMVANALAQLDSQVAGAGNAQVTPESVPLSKDDTSSAQNENEFSGSAQNGSVGNCLEVELNFPATDTDLLDNEWPKQVVVVLPDSSSMLVNQRPDPALAKSIRRASKNLVEHRYRLACKMSAEGESKQWAAAAGMGLGIVGALPTPGKVFSIGKRRLELGEGSEQKKKRLSKGKKSNKDDETTQGEVGAKNKGEAEMPEAHHNTSVSNAAATLRTIAQSMEPEMGKDPDHSPVLGSEARGDSRVLLEVKSTDDKSGDQVSALSSPEERDLAAVASTLDSPDGVIVDSADISLRKSVMGYSTEAEIMETNEVSSAKGTYHEWLAHERAELLVASSRSGDASILMPDVTFVDDESLPLSKIRTSRTSV